MITKTIVIFTESFPYSWAKEDTFILPELPVLSELFERVIFVPFFKDNTEVDLSGYKNIIVDDRHSINPHKVVEKLKIYFSWLTQPLFLKECLLHPSILLSKNKLSEFLYLAGRSTIVRCYFFKLLSRHHLSADDTIFLSYWFDAQTHALAYLRQKAVNLTIVTRAHNADIYPSRTHLKYKPFRRDVLKEIQRVYTVSQAGADYLRSEFPEYSDKIAFSYLGSRGATKVSRPSTDNILRIVSCSFISPVKRVHLIFQNLQQFATTNRNKIHWTHIGGERLKWRDYQDEFLSVSHKGTMKNDKIFRFYEENPVDLFIMLSESEGMPFAVMEALSSGIPIFSTDVGGLREIVSNDVGALVSKDFGFDEFNEQLSKLIDSDLLAKRQQARQTWEKHFNARKNHMAFYEGLKQIKR